MKEYADDNFKFDESGRKLSKPVENTVVKGEIAPYGVIVWEWVNSLPNDKILDQSNFKELEDNKVNVTKKLKFVLGMAENILGKVENAGYQHFLVSPKCF